MLNDVVRGNIQYSAIISVTLSPSVVAPNTTSEQTFTVAGLQVGDFVNVTKPTVQAGLGLVNSRVSAANTLALGFLNATSATITPTASEVYSIGFDRPIGSPPTNAL